MRDGRRDGVARRISPNADVGADCYVNSILADSSAVLTEALAGGHRPVRRLGPDAGGRRIGSASGPAWSTYMQEGPDSLTGVLDDIEASWPTE